MGKIVKYSGVNSRNGTPINVGDIIQTVQDTVFEVVEWANQSFIKDADGMLWDLEPFMSPNIWIIGNIVDNPELIPNGGN